MPSDRDYEFARIAVERKLLAQEQADSLLGDLGAAESLGVAESLAQLAVKRGLLAEADSRAITEQVERALGQRVEVGGFEIIERIGRGGMGAVYKARQLSMDRIVALKILPPRLARNQDYVHRFIREARAAAKLNHPNIVQGIDVGKSGPYYYFAMEYVDGETAGAKLTRQGPLAEEDALTIAVQVARALEHAHTRANIIHRDVKPQNIIIASNGRTKLADLGLAREAVHADTGVTYTGITLGTPDYISPEQIRGEAGLDGRSDIYSLGATLYHLLAGVPPYRGETGNVVMAKHLTEPVPNVGATRSDVSAQTAAIIRRAMQKDRSGRFQAAGDMADALEAALYRLRPQTEPAPTTARLIRPARGRRARPKSSLVPVLLGLIALGVVAGVIALLVLRSGGPPRTRSGEPPPRDTAADRGEKPPDDTHEPRPNTAARAYARAQQLAVEHKGKPWLLVQALRAIADECRGTDYESAVALLVDKAKDELRAAAELKLDELEERSGALAAKGSYAAAAAVFDEFPKELLVDEWPARVGSARGAVISRATAAYQDREREAKTAADARDFDRAIQTIEDVTRWGLPQFVSSAEKLIDSWRDEKAKDERRAKNERSVAVLSYTSRILGAAQRREYGEARGLARRAAADPVLGDEAKQFATLETDIGTVDSLWQDAEQRVRGLRPGDDVRVGSILLKFVKYENGIVTAELGGAARSLPLREMGDVDLFALLAEAFRSNPSDPGQCMRRGLFYTFDRGRKLDKAVREFDAAEKAGAKEDAARGRSYVALVGRLEPEWAAVRLLADARAAADQKQWKELSAKLSELTKYRDTDASRKNRSELTKLALLASGRGTGLDQLFSGKAELRGADLVTVQYDLRAGKPGVDWRGGTPSADGLLCDRELRWNAGVRLNSVALACTMPERVERVELRLLCTPQGADPLVTAAFGAKGGKRCELAGSVRKEADIRVQAKTETAVEVEIQGPIAKLNVDRLELLDVPVEGQPGGRSVILRTHGVPVIVHRITVTGRLELEWGKQRAADLADIAGAALLGTVEVPADKEWADTGLTLELGRYYHLRAAGCWRYGADRREEVSAAGEPREVHYMPLGGLAAMVGSSIYFVGEEAIIGPDLEGRLRLGMNEVPGGHGDNSGKLTVEVRRLGRPAPLPPEPGLLATYYAGSNFDKVKHVRVDPALSLPEDGIKRAAGQPEHFSVRWEGFIRVPETGEYELGMTADDGFRLWLDDRKLLDRWNMGPKNKQKTPLIRLERGLHGIRAEYFQDSGAAFLNLWWRHGGKSDLIPPAAFSHQAARAAPP